MIRNSLLIILIIKASFLLVSDILSHLSIFVNVFGQQKGPKPFGLRPDLLPDFKYRSCVVDIQLVT